MSTEKVMTLSKKVEALREALARHVFDESGVPCSDCPPVGCAGVQGRYQWERCEGLDIWLGTADLPAQIAALEKMAEAAEKHRGFDGLSGDEFVAQHALFAANLEILDTALAAWREGRRE